MTRLQANNKDQDNRDPYQGHVLSVFCLSRLCFVEYCHSDLLDLGIAYSLISETESWEENFNQPLYIILELKCRPINKLTRHDDTELGEKR